MSAFCIDSNNDNFALHNIDILCVFPTNFKMLKKKKITFFYISLILRIFFLMFGLRNHFKVYVFLKENNWYLRSALQVRITPR